MESKKNYTTGLTNVNNNCYMNSIFQCLTHSSYLMNYINSIHFDEDFREDYSNNILVKELRKLLSLLWLREDSINPSKFIQYFQKYLLNENSNTGITIGYHNDANEFLILILSIIHKYVEFVPNIEITINNKNLSSFDKVALKACNTWKQHFKDSYSQIIELFYGQFISELENNDEISHCFDPFQNFDLEIPDNQNIGNEILIEDCIETFMKKENISENLNKSFYIWKNPKILIITLKRFNNQGVKNNSRIIYKESLDLSKFCKGYIRENCIYKLFGICCHNGTLDFGHYFSLCRKKNSSEWYKYNDEETKLITKDNVIPLTSSAYILFYELNN